MLPSNLLQTALNHQVMLELKSGETYSGLLVKVDNFMNAQVRDAICVDAHTEKFCRVADVYIRGNSIKYLRLPEEVADMVKPEDAPVKGAAHMGKKGKGKKKGEAAGPQGRGRPAERSERPKEGRPAKKQKQG
ncbi:unnamed protein product [Amoebophrya sp. A120]|nr:unnamed protein product [Amoebophrya sp. A120]|eukprot:GSA120T00002193001.1